MLAATIIFSGRQWLWPSLGVLVVAAAFVFWNYRHSTLPAGARFLCAVLKLIGLLALLLCVLEPLGSGQRARPGANYLALVADNSQGMQVKDRGQTKGRGEVLKAGLADAQADWRARLEEAFQVRSYLFDSRLQSTKDFSELQFDGRASAIGASLRSLADRYRGQPLAGVLLFTDGNATDLTAASLNFEGLPPVYPVVIGADDSIPDLAIQKVSVTQTAFEDSPVTVQADVEAIGYSGEGIVAQLLDPATVVTNAAGTREGKVVAQQSLRAGRDGEPVIFRLQYRPEKTGVTFYQLRVSAKDELEQFTKPTASREATLANNSRTVVVDRGGGPFRVLYVSGRPNWEFKFLNRALDEEKDLVQLVGLIRIAKREPKFEFRGRAGESSNPLFRGFDGKSKEEIERYDQPVLIRFNTRDQLELSGGFPKTAEDLFAYHAIILDDLEAEFFTHEQMVLLQKFVSERGGGFLMLGGQESFANGKYERTPIADMLPVYLDRAPVGRPLGEAKLNLTREGWLQPWARLRNNEADERTRLEEMPSFLVVNRVREVKPGASVVATVTDAKGTLVPAVATQRYGSGRAVAMMIGDFWHWGFRDEATHRDMDKAWRQLIRHVLADVPERVTIEARPKPDDPNQAVELSVRVRDQKFQPLDNASVSFRIQAFPNEPVAPGTNSPGTVATNLARFTAEAATSEPGLYVGSHIPRITGGYKAVAVVTNAAGAEVGRAEAGWTADPAAEEFRSLKPNRALMELLARKTGGEIVPFAKLDQFVRELPNRKAPVADTWTYPLWHRAPVLLFALICFVAEWALRRTKGLA